MVNKKQYDDLKASGLCTKCRKPLGDSPSSARCATCYEKFRNARETKKLDRLENNICIQCGNKKAVKNLKLCYECKNHNLELRNNLSENPIVKYDPTNKNCKICNNIIDTLGIVCQKCLSDITFTKADAFKRYDPKCSICNENDINNLRFTSVDINEPMEKFGPDLYKIICYSVNVPKEYRILCHNCYRKESIDYIIDAQEFFDYSQNKDEKENSDFIDIDSLNE